MVMKEQLQLYTPDEHDTERDFAEWERELQSDRAEAFKQQIPEYVPEEHDTKRDFARWEQELQSNDAKALEQQVLENPEEPQTSWVESNADGTVSEQQYCQQSYWVIGQFGHAMDIVKANITTDEQAEEWLEMKMSIAAAKSVSDAYELAAIRTEMIPIWSAYVESMNIDWAAYEKVCNV